jgi:hypothetical protein
MLKQVQHDEIKAVWIPAPALIDRDLRFAPTGMTAKRDAENKFPETSSGQAP